MFLQTPSQDGCAAPHPIRRCSCLSAGHRWSHKHELHCADTYIYIVYLFVTTYAEWLWEINIRLKCTDSQMYKPLKWELFKLWSEAMQSPLVDLFHRYALPLGNILNCFTAFWDDANISCYCLCSNWMVSSYHDNLKLWEKKLHYVSKNYFLELKPSKKTSRLSVAIVTHPDTSSTAFHHCIGYSGSWWVNHWDEASKAQSRCGEIHVIRFKLIATRKLFLI